MLRVNGEIVDPQLVEETFTRIKAEAEQRLQVSCCERDPEFREQAEDEVADSILIAQESEKKYPVIPEAEIKPELKRVIDLYREHGASWEMLEEQRDNLRGEISATLRMEKFINDAIGGRTEISDEDAEKFYQKHLEEYTSPAESACLHLMKPLGDDVSYPDLFEEMVALRQEALAGADFEELAKRETQKENGEVDLGYIVLDRPTNPFETVLFSLNEGEVSPVLTYEHAFHLIKVTDRKEPRVTPLEEVREEIDSRALAYRKREALEALAKKLRKDATIERAEEE